MPAPWGIHEIIGKLLENIGIFGCSDSCEFPWCRNHWKSIRNTWYSGGSKCRRHGEFTRSVENYWKTLLFPDGIIPVNPNGIEMIGKALGILGIPTGASADAMGN